MASVVSQSNSTAVPLGPAGVFTGAAELVTALSNVTVSVYSDQSSASQGISFQFSSNGLDWDEVATDTLVAGVAYTKSLGARNAYFRLVFTNGGTGQGTFRLTTIFHDYLSGHVSSLASVSVATDLAILGHSLMLGLTGGGAYVPILSDSLGNLTVNQGTPGLGTARWPVAVTDTSDTVVRPGDSANNAIRVNVVAGGGSGSNAAAGPTGSAVPADADYIGFNSGGNLVGVSAVNPLPITGSISATNPSVGTLGAVLPSSATLIGASDGTDLQQLLVESATHQNLRISLYQGGTEATVTAGNALKVDGSAVTQPVSGTITANQGTSPWVDNITQWGSNAVVTGGTNGSVGVGGLAATNTSAAGNPVLIAGSDYGGTPKAQNLKVDASGFVHVTLEASTGTSVVSGTVTANAGTNLNTSALALDTSVNGLLLGQGSTTSGQKGALIQGAVSSAAPSYTTAQTSPLSLTLAGALRVDGSAVTQPISGTVTTTPPANASTNVAQFGGAAVVTGTGASGSGIPRITVSNDSVISSITNTVTVSGTVTTTPPANASTNVAQWGSNAVVTGGINGSVGVGGLAATNTSAAGNPILIAGSDYGGTPKAQNLKVDASGFVHVTLEASTGTSVVSGTVTANQGGAPWSQNLTQIAGTGIVTGGVNGSQGVGGLAATNTNAAGNPVLIAGSDYGGTAKAQNLKVDSSGFVHVTLEASTGTSVVSVTGTVGVTQSTSPWVDNITQWGSNAVVTGGSNGSVGVGGLAAANAALVGNPILIAGSDYGGTAKAQNLKVDSSGFVHVTLEASTGTSVVSGTVTANQGGAPWSQNLTQIAGSAVATAASGTLKVGISDSSGGTLNSVTKGNQAANALGVQDLKDSGRSMLSLTYTNTTSTTTTTVTVLTTLVQNSNWVSSTGVTAFQVPSGKTLRLQGISATAANNSTTTTATQAQCVYVDVRVSTTNTTTALGTAPIAATIAVPINDSNLEYGNNVELGFPDGIEVPASDYVGLAIHNANTNVATTLLGVTLIGYTY